jgi:hypothetical protein
MWSKAKFPPIKKTVHRKAKRVGERLHFDLFTSSVRSSDGCKYLLVVVDEFSGFVWAFGLRKKSETFTCLTLLVKKIEKMLGKRVEGFMNDCDVDCGGVSAFRCDNAGENVLQEMKDWCAERGTTLETMVPYMHYQNGKSERVGGLVFKGGAAFRYGGNLPDGEWVRCCLAFVHVRNRLPGSSCEEGKTPYGVLHGVDVSAVELIDHFRVVGCLCYWLVPHELRVGKKQIAVRCVLLGYLDDIEGRKGYLARRLSDGKLVQGARNQFIFYEDKLVYPSSPDYDRWVKEDIAGRDRLIEENVKNDEVKGVDDESECELVSEDEGEVKSEETDEMSCVGDDLAGVDLGRKVSEEGNEDEGENVDFNVIPDLSLSDDDESSDSESEEVMDRLERGEPISSSPGGVNTRGVTRAGEQEEKNHTPSQSQSQSQSDLDEPPEDCHDEEDQDYSRSEVSGDGEEEGEEKRGKSVKGSEEEGRKFWEPRRILKDRLKKKRGKKKRRREYYTEWVNGEFSWEPEGSFALSSDDERGNVLSEYKEKIYSALGREQVGGDENERVQDEEEGNDDDDGGGSEPTGGWVKKKKVVARVIRILKMIVKAGVVVPNTRKQALKNLMWPEFARAEKQEIGNFDHHEVWELMQRPKGVNVIGVKWVYDVKVNADGEVERYKARLVARGFGQKEGIDFNETFAPTMHIKTARTLFAIAAREGIEVRTYDVSTAFLHAPLSEDVYVRQPEGFVVKGKEDYVYKLRKAMYGLKNAPRAYSQFFMKILKKMGFVQSKKDDCLWSLMKGDVFVHYLFHVDDILVVANNECVRDACFIALEKNLNIRDEGPISGRKFLGMRVMRLGDGSYTLDQKQYIESMAKHFGVGDRKRVKSPCTYGEKLTHDMCPTTKEGREIARKLPYQSLVGSLIYACKTRMDVSYAVSNVARYMSCWGEMHYEAALRVLTYLYHDRDRVLTISPSNNNFTLSVYCDANYADEREGHIVPAGGKGHVSDDNNILDPVVEAKWKSQGGFVMCLGGCPVSWRSRRHRCRVLSSMEAEYVEATEAAKEVLWFRELMNELGYGMVKPTPLYEDNKGCIAFSKNNTCHDRTKHIDMRRYYLRDLVATGAIEVVHVKSDQQLADILTKAQLVHTFVRQRDVVYSGKEVTVRVMRAERQNGCLCVTCVCGSTKLMKVNEHVGCSCITCLVDKIESM